MRVNLGPAAPVNEEVSDCGLFGSRGSSRVVSSTESAMVKKSYDSFDIIMLAGYEVFKHRAFILTAITQKVKVRQ